MIPFAAFTFRQVTAGRNAGIWVIGAIIIIIFPVHLKSLHLKKCIIKWPTLTRLLSLSDGHLLGGFHLLHAITAKDVHGFCGSHALVAAGANIFAGAAGILGLGDCSVACPFGERSNYIPQADRLAHLKVLPALFLDEVQQRKPGACNRPTVFWMLLNAKPVTFGNLLILPIVVKVPGTAGIFDTFFCRKAMAHFVQKRGAGLQYVDLLRDKGVAVHILNMGLLDNSPMGRLVATMLLAFAEFERAQIIERTQSGRQAAMAKPGFRDGRPLKFTALQLEHALGLLSEYSYKQVEAMTGISRSTLQRAKKKVEVQQ